MQRIHIHSRIMIHLSLRLKFRHKRLITLDIGCNA